MQADLKKKIHALEFKRKIFFLHHTHITKELNAGQKEQAEFEHVWAVSIKAELKELSGRTEDLDPGDDSGKIRVFDYVPPVGSEVWPSGVVTFKSKDPAMSRTLSKFELKPGECFVVEVDHFVEQAKNKADEGKLHSHVQMLMEKYTDQFPYCAKNGKPTLR